MEHFRNIGLIGQKGGDLVIDTLRHLIRFLQSCNVNIIVEHETARQIADHGQQECSQKLLGESCDLVIVVGGDGSILSAGRQLARYGVPVLGVNRGRLGFLTDISPSEVEDKVGAVLAGSYKVESRFLLEVHIVRDGQPIGHGDALNDVVVHSGKPVRMLEFDLFIEGEYVYTQRSDGLIVSTPTGSTAYALSAGGPIMHPKLDAIALVPMFPHTLSSRPIVIDAKSEIKIVISASNETHPIVSCDGHNQVSILPGDKIYIRKKAHKLQLLHPTQHNFYESCRSKLGWGSTP